MEDNKKAAKAFVDNYFPKPNSKVNDVLSDLFPPKSQLESSRKQGYDGRSSRGQDGYSKEKSGKSQSSSQKSTGNPVVYYEVSEPCSMSSSVDYGCRDNYYPATAANRQPGSSHDKKDDYEYQDPKHTRGEWWQGSLYY